MMVCSEIRTKERQKRTRKEQILAENRITEISGDRRVDRRYGVELPLEYTVTRNGRVIAKGTGRTIDLSTSGTAFLPATALECGMYVEALIEWPTGGDEHPMQLVVSGSVVRYDGRAAAIRIGSRRFLRDARASWTPLVMAAGVQ